MTKKLDEYTKEELIEAIKSLKKRKKFGLVWEDKSEKVVDQCQEMLPVLEEVPEKAIAKDINGPTNLIIEGDNYHSLSVLNYTHAGKIDVIYIDPPYNTGKDDFKYNDKWINDEDTFKHSKWLSFMGKRLKLARRLLTEDGIIFLSIDDNEMAQLKMLCDEIFGEENRLSTHHIQVRYGNKSLNEKKDFQELIEYTLIYANNAKCFMANKPSEDYSLAAFNLDIQELKVPDKTIEVNNRRVDIFLAGSYSIKKQKEGNVDLFKETWISGSIYSGTGHGKMYQKVVENRVEEDGLSTIYKIYGLGEDGLGFRYMINPQKASSSRGKMFAKIPVEKRDALEVGSLGRDKPIINFYDYSPDFGNIRQEGGVGFNSGKKPIKMLKHLINYHKNKNATVLDFFAGSGSTGHAVLSLNNDDGGCRRFIIATNNEGKIAEEITYPRIKNVINGYSNSAPVPANVRYFRTDFVNKEKTDDQTRLSLVERCTDMIRIREDTYEPIIAEEDLKLFSGIDHNAAILFNPHNIEECIRKIEKIDIEKPLSIYIFSYSNYAYEEDVPETKLQYTIRPIPESILEVYKRIFKERIDV
ncbi:MAG: site-specific DNA-methyltransferase [Candidatus Saccharibacteria bacterium]